MVWKNKWNQTCVLQWSYKTMMAVKNRLKKGGAN